MATRVVMYGFMVLHWSVPLLMAETGSQACAPCHPGIYKSYRSTAMARSSGVLDAAHRIESFDRAAFQAGDGAKVRVSVADGRVEFSIEDGTRSTRRALDYFVGSGLAGRSYLSALDGFLFQAPVSYYSSQRRWDVSPGFEKQDAVALTRPVETGCLRCHSSRLQPVEGTVNGYASPAFLEGGVSCERCHGAGEAHIAGMKQSTGAVGIVNPAKLQAERRDSICAQCHLSGVTEIARKDSKGLYKPGGLLSDASTVFVWSRGGTLNANSHFERMAQSVCWQASERKMWCGTCHEAHSRPTVVNRAGYYRAKCFSCHTDASCTEKRTVRMAAKNDCLQCHMPRTEMATVRHAAATDHSIPRSLKDRVGDEPASGVLVPFEGKAGDRELGLAYADVALRDGNREPGKRAFELLRTAYKSDPKDSRVGTQLAQLYDRMGDEKKACEIYAEVVAADPDAVAATVNFGSCLARRGQVDESIRLWTEALRRSPGLAAARMNLAVALMGVGKNDEARRVVEEGLKIAPLSRPFAELLTKLRGQ